ncbi:DUF1294 domain-containing protein [Gracilibacillus xinjiangensis]|uniref:DUF1294 domain-containing protein n=1 Tax=Gracilibacillus xinjiangensis TaxID=1193282 RepID=A0ABV8WVD7_9BACI
MLLIYLIIINLIGFIVMGVDKRRARKQKWRIPESRIWFIAIIGGAPGAMIAMNYFRHKTKHTSFRVFLPLLVFVHIGLFVWYEFFLS